jgi:electron transfer flavoprotein beta subunit
MKILVAIKKVPDYQTKVKVKADGSDIETEGVKWIVNPFDEIAVEEAIRMQEAGKATEVVVVSVGNDETVAQLRYAMAMGADRAIHVKHNGPCDSDLASRVLEVIYKKEAPNLVILGKQAIDSDSNQTAQLLAARLNLPQACFASKIVIEEGKATVTREIDGGLETIKISTPCIISTDLRLNEPRFASLPGIMKAKKKPLEEIDINTLGLDINPKLKIKRMATPSKRQAGRKLADVDELLKVLQDEVKII